MSLGLNLSLWAEKKLGPSAPVVYTPNAGAVVFNGTSSYYGATVTSAPADSNQFTGLFWFYPENTTAANVMQAGWFDISGKLTVPVYAAEIRRIGGANNTFRLSISGDSGLILRMNTPVTQRLNEWNLVGFSVDNDAGTFQTLFWTETDGVVIANNVTPSTDTGLIFPWSQITNVNIGTDGFVDPITRYVDGNISQAAMFSTISPNLLDPAVQDIVIQAALYGDFRNLGNAFMAHSGDTSTFDVNGAQNKAYNLFTLDAATSDTTGPAPPFTV